MRTSRVLRVGRLAGEREPRIKRIQMAPPRRIVEDESCPKPPEEGGPYAGDVERDNIHSLSWTGFSYSDYIMLFPLSPVLFIVPLPLWSHPSGWLLSYIRPRTGSLTQKRIWPPRRGRRPRNRKKGVGAGFLNKLWYDLAPIIPQTEQFSAFTKWF